MLMNAANSLLLIIDVQEKLAPTMSASREVISGCARLIGAAGSLGVPCLFTEQYPKGLGPTMVDLRQAAEKNAKYLPKTEFSCAKNEAILQEIKNSGRKQIIMAGVELHICVLQTALDLKAARYDVFVVANACSSQDAAQHVLSYQRLLAAGVEVVSLEMVIYEWLEKSGTDVFKEVVKKYL